MIGHGRLVIESSPDRGATPTLLAKAEVARRAARRDEPASTRDRRDRARFTALVRTALGTLGAQARPRRQVRS